MAAQAHFWFAVDTSVSMARELLSSANSLLSETVFELRNYDNMSSAEVSMGILAFGIGCTVVLPMTPVQNVTVSPLWIGNDLEGEPSLQSLLPLIRNRNDSIEPEEAAGIPAGMSSCVSLRRKLDELAAQDSAELICLCLLTDGMMTDPMETIRQAFASPLAGPWNGNRLEKRFWVWFCSKVEQASMATLHPDRLRAFMSEAVDTKRIDPADLAAGLTAVLTDWESASGSATHIQTVFD